MLGVTLHPYCVRMYEHVRRIQGRGGGGGGGERGARRHHAPILHAHV